MVIGALVGAADHLHRHVAILEHLLVADRRLQQVLILVDPFLEIERLQPSGRMFSSPRIRRRDERSPRRSSLSPQLAKAVASPLFRPR